MMEFSCKCHNSGVNSFTGRCSNCGMTKPSQGVFDRGIGVLPHKSGEYIKIEDILRFESEISAEKRIKQLISSTPNDQELGEKVREMFK